MPVFCDYNLEIILIFHVLELWLMHACMHACTHTHTHTHTHNRFMALLDSVWDYPGKPAWER